ncbi:hypothetical protein VOLCADRAFT_116255 [Volvox carteri f. nagariensis]|uniref:U1-type domain-containing protein n=1 Tax=Volvox carteri f. nagariensis TaxID=3068 RepID=D8TKE1_VOLCA|nr:uncharacterized protein VOLCADRAFT_116255 [Volvox carteri f. nagariensis]EFJ52233.1 hypothetical protein VOLCADRAFT_116255 [Volvox carteri f. nagariensis]|eukprot:XP_002947007.1 hypothetical protein VOLCADRAFT_116255 [Volvox carteri f. nagariensis]
MTEYWKSNAMHWCDVCKCWMNDTKAARLNHERGSQHQAKLATKLRDMARKADQEAKAKATNEVAMSKIEAAAKKQYEQDRKAAAAEAGSWTWDAQCSYYYNATYRWYYDPSTQWYYGGEPEPTWVQSPPLPAAARFGAAPHEGGPIPPATAQQGGPISTTSSSAAAAGNPVIMLKTVQRVVAVPKHPLAGVGGYQAPTSGRVGGSMGTGVVLEGDGGGSSTADVGSKRKREEPGKVGGPAAAGGTKGAVGGGAAKGMMSAEEAEALARREAAKQRVAQRTAAGFGYL